MFYIGIFLKTEDCEGVILLVGSSYVWVNAVCDLPYTSVIDCHECNSSLKHETLGNTQSHEFET